MQLIGAWSINTTNILGAGVPGEGYVLPYEYCDEPHCTGKAYKTSDGTTVTFTDEFIEIDTRILTEAKSIKAATTILPRW